MENLMPPTDRNSVPETAFASGDGKSKCVGCGHGSCSGDGEFPVRSLPNTPCEEYANPGVFQGGAEYSTGEIEADPRPFWHVSTIAGVVASQPIGSQSAGLDD